MGWNWTLPGRHYEKVGDEFSERVELPPPVFVLGQPAAPGGTEAPPADPPERLQLKRRDGTAVVQVGPSVLVMAHLRPYPNRLWFRELVIEIYEQHMPINEGFAPQRIGPRCIDHFSIEELDLPLDMPVVAMPEEILCMKANSFFQKFDLEIRTPPALLVHPCGTIDVRGASIFVLDLDSFSSGVTSRSGSERVESRLDTAHDAIERAFVGSMSAELYERLRRGGER